MDLNTDDCASIYDIDYTQSKEDLFYRKAKIEGYRARSVYKLQHVDEVYSLFSGVTRAVDQCAAPGSWSQLLASELHKGKEGEASSCIVSIDQQEMAPIAGVELIQGDITSPEVANAVIAKFAGHGAQLVVCDGAPDVTGLHSVDEFMQSQQLYAAMLISSRISEKGADFCAKFFLGNQVDLLTAQQNLLYEHVYVLKPSSSRFRSAEYFIIGKKYKYSMMESQVLGLDLAGHASDLAKLQNMGDLNK